MSSVLIVVLWIVLPIFGLLIFVYATTDNLRRSRFSGIGMEDIVPFLRPVLIDALEQLTDPLEEEYLRWRCTKAEFRSIQQRRVRVSIEYLRRMNHNARILRRLGVSQLESGNPTLQTLGQELIDAGVNVRIYTFMALVMLYFWKTVRLRPWPFVSAPKLTDLRKLLKSDLIPAYRQLKENANRFALLKASAFSEALAQNL